MKAFHILFFLLHVVLLFSQESADDYHAKADEYFEFGKLNLALEHYQLADSLYKEDQSWSQSCDCQYGILYTKLRLGKAQPVLEGIGESIRFCEETIGKNTVEVGKLYYLDGIIENHLRDATFTIDKANKAINTLLPITGKKHKVVASAYNLAGIAYYNQKDYNKALEYYQLALDIKEDLNGPDHISLGTSLNNIGIIYQRIGEIDKAIDYYNRSLKLKIKKYGLNHTRVSDTKFNIGQLYLANENYSKAMEFITEAIRINKINEEFQDYKLAHRLSSLSEAYYGLGRVDLAIKYGEESIAHYQRTELNPQYSSTGFQSLGSVYRKAGMYSNAVQQYQSALKTLTGPFEQEEFGTPEVSKWLASDRLLQILNKKAGALKEWYETEPDLKLLEYSLEASHRAIEVINYLLADITSDKSNYLFLSENRHIYETALWTCYELFHQTGDENYLHEAINIEANSKALLLEKTIQQNQTIANSDIPDSLYNKLSDMKSEIEGLTINQGNQDDLLQLKTDYDQLENYIINEYLDQKEDLMVVLDEVDANELQKQLKKNNEALYSWYIGASHGFTFYLDGSQKAFYRFEIDSVFTNHISALSELVSSLSNAIGKSNDVSLYNQFVNHSSELFSMLFPNEVAFESIVLLPDGLMHTIPLELLITDKTGVSENVNYRDLSYLLRKSSVRYLHNLGQLIEVQESNQGGQLIAMAPSYEDKNIPVLASRSGFTDLIHTKEEVSTIHSLIGGKKIIGDGATKTEFTENVRSYQALHLAMHAYSDNENPSASGLIFSPMGPEDDNILYAYEIAAMDLDAELVVLSACNSGSGKLVSGEGNISLARSFIEAGCQNVIMSLWQADDESTSEIMSTFYEELNNGEGKANALRKAKLNYLDNHEKQFPYFWSTFILTGDNQGVVFDSFNTQWPIYGAVLLLSMVILAFYIKKKKSA